jgi:hypothetical protein
MAGVDVGVEWVLLIWNLEPVPVPDNCDSSLRPLMERDGNVTQKFGFVETFDCMPFMGTMEKMRCTRPKGVLPKWKKDKKGSALPLSMVSRLQELSHKCWAVQT